MSTQTCCICGRPFTDDKPSIKPNDWDTAHATCEDPDNPGRRFIKGLEKETEKVERRDHDGLLHKMWRAGR